MTQPAPRPDQTPPEGLLGQFEDDYGSRWRIGDSLVEQLPRATYHVTEWHAVARFLVARADAANPGQPGRWIRLDWMPLSGMAPWEWGVCLTTWDAPDAATARAAPPANRAVPRTGCGGNPFTRLRPDHVPSVTVPLPGG